MSKLTGLFTLIVLLAACSPAAAILPNPYAPQSGDGGLVRDGIQIVSAEVVRSSGTPATSTLVLSYFLPTPCHQFRLAISGPDAGNKITVDAYSLMKKDQVCTLMRLANPSQASLVLSGLSNGKYTVWVNGSMAGEATVP